MVSGQLSFGLATSARETLLVSRAADFLAAGPCDARTLIAHVCQIPMVPEAVASHMAAAMFAEHPRFHCGGDGQWQLRDGSMRQGQVPRCAQDDKAAVIRNLSFAVVDVETTGTRTWQGDRITEIAAVVVKNGEIAEVFETLVNPQRAIPPWITQLTRITWDMVKDAPVFADIAPRLLETLDGNVFVAHNARFDWGFVGMEVQRATGRVLEGPQLCTVRLARKILPQLRSRSLDYVARHYGVEIEPRLRHRAAGDAMATARVLLRLLDDARDRGVESWNDLELLLATSAAKSRRRRPPAMPQPVAKDTTA